jgi:hypothetical protein
MPSGKNLDGSLKTEKKTKISGYKKQNLKK